MKRSEMLKLMEDLLDVQLQAGMLPPTIVKFVSMCGHEIKINEWELEDE